MHIKDYGGDQVVTLTYGELLDALDSYCLQQYGMGLSAQYCSVVTVNKADSVVTVIAVAEDPDA